MESQAVRGQPGSCGGIYPIQDEEPDAGMEWNGGASFPKPDARTGS